MDRETAFREFAATRSPSLMRLAVLLTGDHQLAEDLLQTTLTKVYVAWGRIRDPGAAHAYARRVMTTTYTSWWRRRSFGERASDPHGPSVADDHHAHADPAIAVIQRDELRRLLAELPRVQRAVLVLRFFEDLSVDETARALQLNPGTVKSHTSRALAQIRIDLGQASLTGEGRSS